MPARPIADLTSGELISALRPGSVADDDARRRAAIQLAERLAAQGHSRAARIVIGRHGGYGPVVIEVTPAGMTAPAIEISERGNEIAVAAPDFEDREITRPYVSVGLPHPLRHTGRRTWRQLLVDASAVGSPVDLVFEGPHQPAEDMP